MRYFRYVVVAVFSIFAIVFTFAPRPAENPSMSMTSPSISEVRLTLDQEDARFMTALSLMQGHLIAGKQLLDQGTPDQAEPHLGHPINELYAEVETQLKAHNAPDMKDALITLYDASQYAPAGSEVADSYELSIKQINQAIATLPEEKRLSPAFVLKAINEILTVADIEYRAGIAKGKIVEPIEYQDSMGFAIISQQMYDQIAERLSQLSPETASAIESSLAKLRTAWPSVNSPDSAILMPDEVSNLIEAIKSSSETLAS